MHRTDTIEERESLGAHKAIALPLVVLFLVLLAILYAPDTSTAQGEPSWKLRSAKQTLWMKTPYSRVKLFYEKGYRCMGFFDGKEVLTQTCMHLKQPLAYGAEYIGMMFAAAVIPPTPPKRILVLGLGGATLPRLLRRFFPKARIDTVDIDPGVVQIARHFFGFRTTPKIRAFVEDARTFVRARTGKPRYDLIYIDCFDAKYIPTHLLDLGFFREVSKILSPSGVMAANIFMTHARYKETLASWKAVFPRLWRMKGVDSGNTIVLGSSAPTWQRQSDLIRRAKAWEVKHKSALRMVKEMKKAKPVGRLEGIRLLKSAKWSPSATSSTGIGKRAMCCGIAGYWRGSFGHRTTNNANVFKVKGRIWMQAGECVGRFVHKWREGKREKQSVEDFRLSCTKSGHVDMKGVLALGRRAKLHHFRLAKRGAAWRGQLVRKGKLVGAIQLMSLVKRRHSERRVHTTKKIKGVKR